MLVLRSSALEEEVVETHFLTIFSINICLTERFRNGKMSPLMILVS